MAIDLTALELGPCQVTWNATDLGVFQEDVMFNLEADVERQTALPFGNTPLHHYLFGLAATVELTMNEVSLAKIALALNTTVTTGAGTSYVSIISPQGAKITPQQLVITKYTAGAVSTAEADKIYLYKAVPIVSMAFALGRAPRGVKVTFEAQPSASATPAYAIGHFGDNVP